MSPGIAEWKFQVLLACSPCGWRRQSQTSWSHPRCNGFQAVVSMCHPDRGVAEWRDLPHVRQLWVFLTGIWWFWADRSSRQPYGRRPGDVTVAKGAAWSQAANGTGLTKDLIWSI